ncbi:hypothetical protein Z043_103517 [Scleropages formosus]|uniref:Uncharacterized protein n=1 Tax=Scleropages formosus TaxID=113540 RepID=A0A0N8K292_SCLFO|nr:hypothetical protein Z043_103517 [Scleropages formosus]
MTMRYLASPGAPSVKQSLIEKDAHADVAAWEAMGSPGVRLPAVLRRHLRASLEQGGLCRAPCRRFWFESCPGDVVYRSALSVAARLREIRPIGAASTPCRKAHLVPESCIQAQWQKPHRKPPRTRFCSGVT